MFQTIGNDLGWNDVRFVLWAVHVKILHLAWGHGQMFVIDVLLLLHVD